MLQRCHFVFDEREVQIPRLFLGAPWDRRGYYHFINNGAYSVGLFRDIAAELSISSLHLHLVAGKLVVTFARREALKAGETTAHFGYNLAGRTFGCTSMSPGRLGKEAGIIQVQAALACAFASACKFDFDGLAPTIEDLAVEFSGFKRKEKKEPEKEKESESTKREREEGNDDEQPKKARGEEPKISLADARKILNKIKVADLNLSPLQAQMLGSWNKKGAGDRALFLRNGDFAAVIEAAARAVGYTGPVPNARQLHDAVT
jgi:hypothetical protein